MLNDASFKADLKTFSRKNQQPAGLLQEVADLEFARVVLVIYLKVSQYVNYEVMNKRQNQSF